MATPAHQNPDAFSATHSPKWLLWAKAHQEVIAVAGILLVLLSAGVPYYLNSRAQSEKSALGVLNLGQYYFHSEVDPKNGPFKSEQEKHQQALQTFQRITTDHSGTSAAKIARYYAARCQFALGQLAQSYSSFDTACQELKGTPLGEQAYLGKILCLEGQNLLPQAATLAESYLKEKPDSFIAPEIRLNLSEVYLKTDKREKALEELKKVAETQTDSNWGREAARRLENLKS
jgi:tetratricopeptide (TPR) repeat protein